MTTMPTPNSREAPKFDGKAASLHRFFDEVDRLAAGCIPTLAANDNAKIQAAIRYANNDDYELWNTINLTTANTWTLFKDAVRVFYPGADENRKYTVSDLEFLAEKWAEKGINNTTDFGEYYREFYKVSNFLKTKARIVDREISMYFQQGFPIKLRNELRVQLRISVAGRHPDDPYTLQEVHDAALLVLSGRGGNVASIPELGSLLAQESQTRVKTETHDISSMFSNGAFVDSLTSAIAQKLNLNVAPPPGRFVQNYSPQNYQQPSYTNTTYMPARNTNCVFCSEPNHFHLNCPIAADYIRRGLCQRNQVTRQIELPNGLLVGASMANGRNLKERLDNWHSVNGQQRNNNTVSTNLVQISPSATSRGEFTATIEEIDDLPEDSYLPTSRDKEELAKLKVFAVASQKKLDDAEKRFSKEGPTTRSKAKASAPVQPAKNSQAPAPIANRTGQSLAPEPQYKFVCPAENPIIIKRAFQKLLEGRELNLEETLAISPEMRKQTREYVTTKKVPVQGATLLNKESATAVASVNVTALKPRDDDKVVAKHTEQLRTIEVGLSRGTTAEAILDDGSQVIAIRKDIWEASGEALRTDYRMTMESANSTTNQTMGLINDLKITIGGFDFFVQAQVVEEAPYEMLLGRPFFTLTQAIIRHFKDGGSHITMIDPNSNASVAVPTQSKSNKSSKPKAEVKPDEARLHEEDVDQDF